ncbi:hypothetical protein SAMN04488012_102274 [Palleronia salina]|uniref:Uncharacterized protein n=1 Tax=Palleronia salina TaxID=313368 RepID=A0A1M6D610_9RHOB|nr:hypothetical protein [Palleronia salina]SHI68685.1 hypothetical protein SAMN04488012_102274 [Palleronia salina]
MTGALLRGIMVALLIATPSLILPIVSDDTTQAVAFIAICAGVLTLFEYGSRYPCLYEFRDAAPFNRIRFTMLFLTVAAISLIARGQSDPNSLTVLLEIVGHVIGRAMDFPYSPVRLLVLMMPEDATVRELLLVRSAVGLAHVISLLSLAVFVLLLGRRSWPLKGGSFNVWVNLPTFDPTRGGDVVTRLERDGRINVLFGLLLPFLMPVAISTASDQFGRISLQDPQTMVWVISAWAFLPASLFMRGIAMARIATMIDERRRQSSLNAGGMVSA